MLRIGINNGTAQLTTFTVEGRLQDDIAAIVDEYVQDHEDDFATVGYYELMEYYDSEEEIAENSFPINGGEYYIGRVELVEEVKEA